MEILWQELSFGFADQTEFIRVLIRIFASFLCGGIIGFQRERTGKPAGLRTHILVSLGTTVFVLGCIGAGMQSDALSRVIQGIVTGIGFIGAGAIMKIDTERDVKGLTSAAGVWITASIGVVIGLGELGLGIITTLIALTVLTLVHSAEPWVEKKKKKGIRKTEDKE